MTASASPSSSASSSASSRSRTSGWSSAPEGDGGKAQPFDEVVDRLAGLLRDDLAEQRTEQPDLERERVAGPRGADAAWFRGTRGSGSMAAPRSCCGPCP